MLERCGCGEFDEKMEAMRKRDEGKNKLPEPEGEYRWDASDLFQMRET